MAQHDYSIANQSGSAFRSDLNNALAAIVSNNSGTTEPTTTYAFQWWADTTTGQLKLRNAANSAWIVVQELDGTLLMEDGTVSLPGLAFASDLNTGFFRPGADQLAIATNGIERVEFGTTEVVFNDGGNDIDFRIEGDTNANLFFVDAGNDRIGLGTSEPNGLKLGFGPTTAQKNGIDYVSASPYSYTDIYGCGISGGWAGQIRFFTSNAGAAQQRAVIDEAGRVGIGTTAASQLLTVSSGTSADGIRCVNTTNSSGSRSRIGFSATNGFDTTSVNASIDAVLTSNGNTATSLVFSTSANDNLASAGLSERARIDSSGRLLVGTSTWSSDHGVVVAKSGSNSSGSLFVGKYDNIMSNGDFAGQIAFGSSYDGNIGALIKSEADANWTHGTSHPGRLVFSTTADGDPSPTERMRIGNQGRLRSFGSDNIAFELATSSTAGTTNLLFSGNYGAGGVGGGTESIRIFSNGNIQNTNNSYGAISDVKLKENIVDATSQWDDLKALQVRKYNFKEGQTHAQIGLIAQEVELVSPGLVSESPDRDAEGNDLGTVTKSVNYSVLYMKAVKALQEAMERIEVLEAKVNALEGN